MSQHVVMLQVRAAYSFQKLLSNVNRELQSSPILGGLEQLKELSYCFEMLIDTTDSAISEAQEAGSMMSLFFQVCCRGIF